MSEFLSKLEKSNTYKRPIKRVGRGGGSGKGFHTTGKGNKGQKARSGGQTKLYFEGGQMPLVRRLPYKQGFKNVNSKTFVTFNLSQVDAIVTKYSLKEFSPKSIVEAGIIKLKSGEIVKILSRGSLTQKIEFKDVVLSKKASAKTTPKTTTTSKVEKE